MAENERYLEYEKDIRTRLHTNLLDFFDNTNPDLLTIIRDNSFSGKLLRAKLVVAMTKHLGHSNFMDTLTTTVELIHLASLIHDDIIDKSEIRRNKKSFWKENSLQGAVLTGDLIICQVIDHFHKLYPQHFTFLLTALKRLANSEAEHELLYKNNAKQSKLIEIYTNKTGSLFSFIFEVINNEYDLNIKNISDVGNELGLIYQLADDYYDKYGIQKDKPVRVDENKITLTDYYNSKEQLLLEINSKLENIYFNNPFTGEFKNNFKNYIIDDLTPALQKLTTNQILDEKYGK
jgi:geranylgeranyl pyrophosphate synthase